ncbi:MAG: hypothetical protein ACTSQZ_04575 [Candidatus Thorarchaeota archaeon]
MEFRYTEKIGYVIAVVSIIAPFYITIQAQFFDDPMTMILGPFWQIFLTGLEITHFAMHPLVPLLYLPFWGPGLYIAKIARDEAKLQEKTRYEYAIRIGKILFLQMLVLIYFTLASGGMPEPLDFPIPAAGILALLLTPITVKGQEKVWEEQDTFGEEETNQ